jgi:hypothetical protein
MTLQILFTFWLWIFLIVLDHEHEEKETKSGTNSTYKRNSKPKVEFAKATSISITCNNNSDNHNFANGRSFQHIPLKLLVDNVLHLLQNRSKKNFFFRIETTHALEFVLYLDSSEDPKLAPVKLPSDPTVIILIAGYTVIIY